MGRGSERLSTLDVAGSIPDSRSFLSIALCFDAKDCGGPVSDVAPEQSASMEEICAGHTGYCLEFRSDSVFKGHIKEVRHRDYYEADITGPSQLLSAFIFKNADGQFKIIDSDTDRIVNIFLPISTDRLLIGTTSALPMEAECFNKVGAQYAHELFVASLRSTELTRLAGTIDTAPGLITKTELDLLLNEILGRRR